MVAQGRLSDPQGCWSSKVSSSSADLSKKAADSLYPVMSCRTAAISAVLSLCDNIKGLAELWELCDTPEAEEFKPRAVAAFADDREFGKLVCAKLDELLFIDRSVGPTNGFYYFKLLSHYWHKIRLVSTVSSQRSDPKSAKVESLCVVSTGHHGGREKSTLVSCHCCWRRCTQCR